MEIDPSIDVVIYDKNGEIVGEKSEEVKKEVRPEEEEDLKEEESKEAGAYNEEEKPQKEMDDIEKEISDLSFKSKETEEKDDEEKDGEAENTEDAQEESLINEEEQETADVAAADTLKTDGTTAVAEDAFDEVVAEDAAQDNSKVTEDDAQVSADDDTATNLDQNADEIQESVEEKEMEDDEKVDHNLSHDEDAAEEIQSYQISGDQEETEDQAENTEADVEAVNGDIDEKQDNAEADVEEEGKNKSEDEVAQKPEEIDVDEFVDDEPTDKGTAGSEKSEISDRISEREPKKCGSEQNNNVKTGVKGSLAKFGEPAKAKGMFKVVQTEKCAACDKTVYAMEKLEMNGHVYHRNCFKCSHCSARLTPKTFSMNEGVIYCITHFKQLFARKGNYDEGFGRSQYKKKWGEKGEGATA